METTEPMTEDQEVSLFLQPIEAETEDDTDGETQEVETEDVEDEVDDDASEATDENEGEEEASDDDVDAEDDDEPDDDDSDSEPLFTVRVNGEERQITEQELKNDYSGRAALQQRHEALKSQEEEAQKFAELLQQQRNQLLQLAQQAQDNGFKQPPQMPDPALKDQDPLAYYDLKDQYDRDLMEYNNQQREIAQQQEFAKQQMESQRQQLIRQQEKALIEQNPELAKPENQKAFQKDFLAGKEHYGFSDDDVQQILTDHRAIKAIADAGKWQALQAGKKAAKKPSETAKPVTRPKGKMRDGGKAAKAKKALEAARRTQTDEAWTEAFKIP